MTPETKADASNCNPAPHFPLTNADVMVHFTVNVCSEMRAKFSNSYEPQVCPHDLCETACSKQALSSPSMTAKHSVNISTYNWLRKYNIVVRIHFWSDKLWPSLSCTQSPLTSAPCTQSTYQSGSFLREDMQGYHCSIHQLLFFQAIT